MKIPLQFHKQNRTRGAAMVLVLVLTLITGVGLTAWIYLLANRLIQANSAKHALSRQTVWRSAAAINKDFSLKYQFRDSETQPGMTALLPALKELVGSTNNTLNGYEFTSIWFGKANPFDDTEPGIQSFRSTNVITANRGPFNNITAVSNGPVFVTETSGYRNFLNYDYPYSASSPSRADHADYTNYQKTYPRSLLGDLLTVHKSYNGAAYSIASNFLVRGRVVILDSTPNVSAVKADQVHNISPTATNTTLNSGGTAALMPQNLPATPIFTAGEGNSTTGGAVVDGSLNMINNSTFTPGSINHSVSKWLIVSRGTQTTDLFSTYAAANTTNVTRTGTGTQAGLYFQATSNTSSDVGYGFRTIYEPTGRINKLTVTLNTLGSTAIKLAHNSSNIATDDAGIEQLELVGQTSSSNMNTARSMAPVIIWVEQERLPQIIFNGENYRPIILVIGDRRDRVLDLRWIGSNVAGISSELEWRMHIINQRTSLTASGVSAIRFVVHATSTLNVNIIGGLRTNAAITTDATVSTNRFFISKETEATPIANLAPLLPRDGWLETRVVQ